MNSNRSTPPSKSSHRLSADTTVSGRRRAVHALIASVALAGICGVGAPAYSAGQEFPTKVVRIIVPNPAGGASDVVARLLAQKLSEEWKQPVVVENRAGANGNIGASLVAKSDPDGYTLLLMDASSLAISSSLYPTLNYSPEKDLAPIAIAAYSPHLLVVKNDLPVQTVQELAAYARANPGKLNFGQTPGAITHLAGVLLAEQQGFSWNYIGYKGGAQVISDLAGGQIDVAMNSFLATYPLVKGGNIKMLAVASPTRFGQIPDTPAIAETVPGFVTGSWQGLFTTGGTPPERVRKIHDDIKRITAMPDVQKRLAELGSEPVNKTPDEFRAWMAEQTGYWGKVVRDNDIKLM